jgi:FkbM family methyltransferase
MEQPLKHNDLIYDVGMHKGEDTDYYLKKGFNVIAFEADPNLVSQCKIRFAEEIKNEKLIIIEGAITEALPKETRVNTVKFFRNTNTTELGTVVNDWALRNELLGTSNEVIEVPAIDFSECLNKNGIPHYLKVDIEGMDTICLKALLKFKQKPDYISIESEKVSFPKLKEELNLLTELGYTKFKAINQAAILHQKEPKYSKEGHYIGYDFQNQNGSGLFGSDLPHNWKDYKQVVKRYILIFWGYKLFGDKGKLRNAFLTKITLGTLKRLFRIYIPGWYDTHAMHATLINNER